MEKTEISPGIWFNRLSPRCATLTSKLPNGRPGWRVAYFGFSKWTDATKFVTVVKKMRCDLKVEARKEVKRLIGCKYEVKITIPKDSKVEYPTKVEVARLRAEIEGCTITTAVSKKSDVTHVVYINNIEVIRVHLALLPSIERWQEEIKGLSYDEARKVLTHEYFQSTSTEKAA